MSDLNDELLNYEIGDVEADDTVLTGADEDELLLSDDESISGKLSKQQEEDLLSGKVAPVSASTSSSLQKTNESTKDRVVPTTSSARSTPKRQTVARKCVAANEEVIVAIPTPTIESITEISEAVASTVHAEKESIPAKCETFKSDESDCEQSSVQSNFVCQQSSSQTKPDLSDTENSDNRSEVTKPSPQPTSSQLTATTSATDYDGSANSEINDLEAEDSDESSEHQNRNRKLCVEREQSNQSEELGRPPQQLQQQQHGSYFQRNRGGAHFLLHNNNNNNRHSMPRPHHPYRMPMGENFGPPFMHHFGQPNRHPVNQLRPPFNRMPMQGAISYQRVPPPPPSAMMQHRIQRPMCPPSQSGGNAPVFRPSANAPLLSNYTTPNATAANSFANSSGFANTTGFLRNSLNLPQPLLASPNLPHTGGYTARNLHPSNIQRAPRPYFFPQPETRGGTIGGGFNGAVLPPEMPPRKVLLNPNFKGGVQAATNQLMMDTMKNPQLMSVNREAELLRQQEAFINQNRMHIEKRRRSRDYSPDRERSYSPPARRRPSSRDRDVRKSYSGNAYRGNRGRRANSRDLYENEQKHFESKRRRSGSFDREIDDKNDQKTEEDEETRAYRLKIEKQKAMREKILRDKEMRRRKAAEDIKSKDEEKKLADETAPKLKPIIVTEKKIISLKKKSDGTEQSATVSAPSKPTKSLTIERKIPTATVLPESKRLAAEQSATTAIVKPVVKKSLKCDIDNIDEDELLADSPSPPSISQVAHTKADSKKVDGNTLKSIRAAVAATHTSKTLFTNRRVIVRETVTDVATSSEDAADKTSTHAPATKGIFDRLEKKVIGVNEAAKRKIQRIVIKNTE